ncbi:hypothetical protein KEM56_005382 [Ascosphaera pollenicola]|nr:hypothetical protein KEM56_005382 [Ascosphaera pollenicola]
MSFPSDEWDNYSAQSEQDSGILDCAIPLPPVPDLSTDFDSPISNSPDIGFLSPSDGLLDNCVPVYPLEIPFDFRSAPDTGSSTPDQLALGNDDSETDSFCWPQWVNHALDFQNSSGYWPHQSRVPEFPNQVPREEKPISSPSAALPPTLPNGFRYPKFVVIIDKRSNKRVRIKTTLGNVDIKEIPDSYRRESAVFPRSWKPVNGPMDHQDEKAGSWAEEEKDDDDHDDCDADVKTGFVENSEGMLNDNSTVSSITPPKRKQSVPRSNDAVEPVERAEQQVAKRLRAAKSGGSDSRIALQDGVLIQGLDGLVGVEAALLDGSDTSLALSNDLMVNECKSSAGAINTLYRQAAESLGGSTELHRMVGSLKTTRITRRYPANSKEIKPDKTK